MPVTPSVFAAELVELPRGQAALPREQVAASQRQRLVHGVTTAVADKGFAAVTVADIATRAGVSKKTFYEHFADKTACFVAAYDHGSRAILAATAEAAAAGGPDAIGRLRAGTAAYLAFLAFEAPYARTFTLEVLAAGPAAIARHRACRAAFARSLRTWHATTGLPAASLLDYEAATGLVYEVCGARIAEDRGDELPALLDDLVAAQLRVLGVPA